jgi:hypothetical protein
MPRPFRLHASTLRPLAACLALALGANAFAGAVSSNYLAGASLRGAAAKRNPDRPAAPTQTWTVTNCSDGLAGSLREIILNPNKAKSGDAIDLSQLPILCGTKHSTITLSSGEIDITQDDLTLQGPSADQGTVTISGAKTSRIFRHQGHGMLSITDLTIADGYLHADTYADGGCIRSNPLGGGGSTLYLLRTIVTGCKSVSDTHSSYGGAIDSDQVILVSSTVSDSQALASKGNAFGGGVYATDLFTSLSTISGNVASGMNSRGGGAYGYGSISMLASTIDHNTASFGGGIGSLSATIVDSTISTNNAYQYAAALDVWGDSLTISNSTIASNHANVTSPNAAVFLRGSVAATLVLQSSIIANNTEGAGNTPFDLSLYQGQLTGADNLVIASSQSPPGVITVTGDPKLGPLQFNGGPTRTHALLPGSPAIGAGNHDAMPLGFTFDQRGVGYPRTTGSGAPETTDIGAFEFDTIFSDSFGF